MARCITNFVFAALLLSALSINTATTLQDVQNKVFIMIPAVKAAVAASGKASRPLRLLQQSSNLLNCAQASHNPHAYLCKPIY